MKTFIGVVAGTVAGLFVFLIIGALTQVTNGNGIVGSAATIAIFILAIVGGVKAGTFVYTKISGKKPKKFSFFKKKPIST